MYYQSYMYTHIYINIQDNTLHITYVRSTVYVQYVQYAQYVQYVQYVLYNMYNRYNMYNMYNKYNTYVCTYVQLYVVLGT